MANLIITKQLKEAWYVVIYISAKLPWPNHTRGMVWVDKQLDITGNRFKQQPWNLPLMVV